MIAIVTVRAVLAITALLKLPLLPFRVVRNLLRRQSAPA
ncbi:hypothetical protein J2X36_004241 [Methylobacterium sp. BE186]|nr:hypothetical protein [Methylobacterium sp. BE186]